MRQRENASRRVSKERGLVDIAAGYAGAILSSTLLLQEAMMPFHAEAGMIGLGRTKRRLIETGVRQRWCKKIFIVGRMIGFGESAR